MDSLSFDISLVPGTKLCSRCFIEISAILNNPKDYEDNKFLPKLNSPAFNQSPHLLEPHQQDLELERTYVFNYLIN